MWDLKHSSRDFEVELNYTGTRPSSVPRYYRYYGTVPSVGSDPVKHAKIDVTVCQSFNIVHEALEAVPSTADLEFSRDYLEVIPLSGPQIDPSTIIPPAKLEITKRSSGLANTRNAVDIVTKATFIALDNEPLPNSTSMVQAIGGVVATSVAVAGIAIAAVNADSSRRSANAAERSADTAAAKLEFDREVEANERLSSRSESSESRYSDNPKDSSGKPQKIKQERFSKDQPLSPSNHSNGPVRAMSPLKSATRTKAPTKVKNMSNLADTIQDERRKRLATKLKNVILFKASINRDCHDHDRDNRLNITTRALVNNFGAGKHAKLGEPDSSKNMKGNSMALLNPPPTHRSDLPITEQCRILPASELSAPPSPQTRHPLAPGLQEPDAIELDTITRKDSKSITQPPDDLYETPESCYQADRNPSCDDIACRLSTINLDPTQSMYPPPNSTSKETEQHAWPFERDNSRFGYTSGARFSLICACVVPPVVPP
ncbi:hypothetical protein MMC11_006671 [Xylographa trunciseda]|nr:hypothetical protein [Xylographa trunciseda]